MGGREESLKAVTSVSVMSISASPQPQEGLCPFSGQETEASKPHTIHGCVLGAPSHPGPLRDDIWGDTRVFRVRRGKWAPSSLGAQV